MNIKIDRIKIVVELQALFFFLTMGMGQMVSAQQISREKLAFEKLNNDYHLQRLTADQYLTKADSLVHQLLSEGKRFETNELVDLLRLYEEIAWNDPKRSRDRVNYFYLFFNNARMAKQKGASIYYAEKIAEAYKGIGEEHPLIAQLQLTKIYQELRLYDKVIAVFNTERNYLESLPGLLRQGLVNNSVGLNAMYILSPVTMGYIKMNDTLSVYKTALLAKEIGTILKRSDTLSRPQLLYNDLLMIDIELSVANFERRYDDAGELLNRMEQLKTIYKDQATNFIDINLIRFRIEHYLRLANKDSLGYYIEKYASSPNFGKSQSAEVSEFKAKLAILTNDYRSAYEWLSDALQYERDVHANLMAESSNLLYAFTQAEHNAIALQRAEQVKQERTRWLVIISAIAAISVLTIYLTMLRRSRKAKEQIDALNNAANLQVIAMEEAKRQAIKDEQQRLGQDLHDGLSASMAAIRHKLEILAMDAGDAVLKSELSTLQSEVTLAYEAARNKSHEWFNASEEQDEQSFEQRIKLLADSALPDSRYNKSIHIDDGALSHVGMDTRIALLRIVQEAVTNIIKHAKAKEVNILIYQETDNLVLSIKDNGRGGEIHKLKNSRPSLGLKSIWRRVEYLNGKADLHSGNNGTEIVVTIPLKINQH
ncbi:ATP-binding protein [Parapedobacter defluvii]|uniref:sensor histidine kinase n=1 Tax=Parapedobacter defluvii TaxID=2045106 RepID=UPI00333FB13B